MNRNRNHDLIGKWGKLVWAGLAVLLLTAGGGGGADILRQGGIRGTVLLPPPHQRRVAPRYAGEAGAGPRKVQDIPAVAFIRGEVPGYPFELPPGMVEMRQQDTVFVPALLIIPPGTTVRFPNMDPFFHNVFSYSSPQRFDLGRYPRGKSKDVSFPSPGIVKVYCEVHESMRSAVLILENPFHTVVADDGSFELEGIPPGRYTLVVWHADHGLREVEVEVPAEGYTELTVDFS